METQDLNQKIILNILAFSLINTFPGNSILILLPVKLVKLLAWLPNYATTYTRYILLNIYQSLIYSYLTYGLASWGQFLKTHLNKILILHKRASRTIFFADRRDHAIPFLVDANILPLSFLYYEYVSNFMHDINNNVPLNIFKLFHKTSSIHTYIQYTIIHLREFLRTKH